MFNWTRRGYTENDFRIAWETSTCVADVCRKLGKPPYGGYYKTVYSTVERLGLSSEHMTGSSPLLSRERPGQRRRKKTLDELLVYGDRITTSAIRVRLIEEGVFDHQCFECGGTLWTHPYRDELVPIPLELDHIDGDLLNNVLSNLRLLCPNCHSLTPTYKNKNRRKGR